MRLDLKRLILKLGKKCSKHVFCEPVNKSIKCVTVPGCVVAHALVRMPPGSDLGSAELD